MQSPIERKEETSDLQPTLLIWMNFEITSSEVIAGGDPQQARASAQCQIGRGDRKTRRRSPTAAWCRQVTLRKKFN